MQAAAASLRFLTRITLTDTLGFGGSAFLPLSKASCRGGRLGWCETIFCCTGGCRPISWPSKPSGISALGGPSASAHLGRPHQQCRHQCSTMRVPPPAGSWASMMLGGMLRASSRPASRVRVECGWGEFRNFVPRMRHGQERELHNPCREHLGADWWGLHHQRTLKTISQATGYDDTQRGQAVTPAFRSLRSRSALANASWNCLSCASASW